RVHRRAVPRAAPAQPGWAQPGLLRRMLHRRLSDPADGFRGPPGPAALPAYRSTVSTRPLEGRDALVTCAPRGLGAACAGDLARRGAHPVLIARTQGGLEETDDAIRAVGGQATLLPFDLRQGEKIDPIGPSIHARFGRLDILVHNA